MHQWTKYFQPLIDPEKLTHWFPNIATIEPRVGGKIFFRFSKEVTREKKIMMLSEQLLVSVPNKELSHTWNFTTKPDYSKETIVTWKLYQIDKDKTKLTLVHSGFTNADRLQYDEHNEGWDWYVRRLENFLDSRVKEGNE